MPPVSPTLSVAHFPNRQVDRIRMPRGRLHSRDDQGDVKSLQGSPLKAARGRCGQKSSMSPFFRPRIVWISDQSIRG